MLGFTIAALFLMRELRRAMERLGDVSRMLEQDGRPALLSVRSAAEEASRVAASVRREVDEVVDASKRIRTQVGDAANRVADRVRDLEVVLDILQEEVEDTALDVAAALRATRRGAGVFRSLKRAILGRGR
jgi:methyl-accepting chemotaxis protein